MLLKIHPDTPGARQIKLVTEKLQEGGVIIYPTDSVYGLGCDVYNHKAIEKVAMIKGIKPEKAQFSFIFNDLSQITEFTRQIDNNIFKLMKKNLPGPFTFILEANNNVPRLFKSKKKTIGIRIPDNNIARDIVRELGNPIVTTSVYDDDEILEYTTDPELIYDKYSDRVDIVIDGGFGNNEPSTVLDCTGGVIEILRQGIGELEE